MQALVRSGADLLAVDAEGRTPLCVARVLNSSSNNMIGAMASMIAAFRHGPSLSPNDYRHLSRIAAPVYHPLSKYQP